MSCILGPFDSAGRTQLGGKAGALASLEGLGLPIPPWFAISPEAFTRSLTEDQRQRFARATESDGIRAIVAALRPSQGARQEISSALAVLCPNAELVAVRSSASDEDSAQHSFAGQLDSFLFVRPEDVPEKVAAVWSSGFSERILAYRRENGLPLVPQPPAVLVQRMVNADVSGVAFGADPVTGRRGIAVVSALYGLGTALVSGECDADTYHVDREGHILGREIASKRTAHRFDPAGAEGVRTTSVPEAQAAAPALTDEQVRAVAALVRETGRCFGRPQDIEWAIEGGRLYLLQSRPITSLGAVADPDGALNLWDNSNIAESYNGVTTPLTFSFARAIYEGVYRQFCRIMRVPESLIAANDQTFRRMLGLIRGRVYYNLISWYRVLAVLPGFAFNRRFMEQMMGVREPLPEEILAGLGRASRGARLLDGARLLGSFAGLLGNHLFIDSQIAAFYRRLEAALAPPRVPLEEMRADELASYYHDLERQLLTRWDAPLVNDFFAMIFHGVLRRLGESWCGDRSGMLANDLVRGEGGMISAEPARRLAEMAALAARDPALVAVLCDGDLPAALRAVERHPEFRVLYRAYLDKFGDRCLEELKLESPTLHDDPLLLLRSAGQLARSPARTSGLPRPPSTADLSGLAAGQVRKALARHPLRRLVFSWVLRNARARILHRENLRFERTRLFGRVRRIFVEIGRRLRAVDLLDEPRDVFFLQVEEVLAFVEGTSGSTDLKSTVTLRKREFEGYRASPAPDDRFETRGVVYSGNTFRSQKPAEVAGGEERSGIGCCPGIVRGRVRVITDPRNAVLQPGSILVAERTDPGWVLLFPAAAGLLVERGSLLSHSAIVAREMGIPAIVSIPGVTGWLKDGDLVELDGGAGVVRRVAASHEDGRA